MNNSSKSISPHFLRRAGFAVLGVNALGLPLALLTQIVLSLQLGPAQLGIYELALGWCSSLLLFATLGAELVVVRMLPGLDSIKERSQTVRWAIRRAWRGSILSGILLLLLALSLLVLGKPQHASTFFVAAVFLPFWAQNVIRQSVLKSLHRPALAKAPDTILRPLLLVCLVLGISKFLGTPVASAAMCCHLVAALVVYFIGVQLIRKEFKLTNAESINPAPPGSALVLMFCMAAQSISLEVEKNLLGTLVDSSSVAWFALAARYALLVTFLSETLATVITPSFSKHSMANQQHELQALLRSSSRNWTLGTLALTFPLFVLAPWIIALSGPQFSASLELLYMLGVGLVVASLWGPVVPAMQTIGDERVFLRIQLSTLAAQFVCSFALVLHWGALGATIGQSLALCLRGYLIARWFKRHKNLEIGVLSLGHR